MSGSCAKLVLLPAALVLGAVLLVMGSRWLTVASDDVHPLVAALEQDSRGRWRAAGDLAAALNHPDNQHLKQDPALAARLANILRRELAAGQTDADHVRLQAYLCRALGEFSVEEPLDTLREAAAQGRPNDVRRSALEAIAVLASNVGVERVRGDGPLMSTLLEASNDRNAAIRATVAFTLGVVGGSESEDRLVNLSADVDADVRFNAACGLARSGNAAAVGVLLEMLQPDRSVAVKVNALEAIRQATVANRAFAEGHVESAVRTLSDHDVNPAVREKAATVLDSWEGEAPAEPRTTPPRTTKT